MTETPNLQVIPPEVPSDLIVKDFTPHVRYSAKDDSLTIQWADVSVTERQSGTDVGVSIFNANQFPGQPVVGMRIEGYSRFRQYQD